MLSKRRTYYRPRGHPPPILRHQATKPEAKHPDRTSSQLNQRRSQVSFQPNPLTPRSSSSEPVMAGPLSSGRLPETPTGPSHLALSTLGCSRLNRQASTRRAKSASVRTPLLRSTQPLRRASLRQLPIDRIESAGQQGIIRGRKWLGTQKAVVSGQR
jgi:hypothetical protein